MTSASELFYSRRSRLGRAAPPADFVWLELTDERNFHYASNRRHQHHRHDPDGCDPLSRAPHFRHISHRGYRPVSLGFLFLGFVCLVGWKMEEPNKLLRFSSYLIPRFSVIYQIPRFSVISRHQLGVGIKAYSLFGFLQI